MTYRSVATITEAHTLDMGGTLVKQPLPTQRLEQVDPFLLLHHFGPTEVPPGGRALDVGPHPHRGFEPVTFLFSGGLSHRDSRGNKGELQGGDVQWMTAGRGIIHSERASTAFLEAGGIMEGIQLWINLPKAQKMVQPDYQDIKSDDIPTIELADGQSTIRLVAGSLMDRHGPAQTHTPILAAELHLTAGGKTEISIPEHHNALLYLLDGQIKLNGRFDYHGHQLLHFRPDGEGIHVEGLADRSRALLLAGEPIEEAVVQWGPYVMNTQSEIMEAMRDYQMGKMGVYIED